MSPQRLSTASYTAAACVARASRSRANKACPRKLEMQKVEMVLCFIAHPWLIHHHWTDSTSPPHQTTLEAPKKKWGRKCMHEPAHGVLNLVWYKLKISICEVRPHFDLNRIRSKQRLQALDLSWKTVQTSGWEPFKDDCYSEWLSKKVGLCWTQTCFESCWLTLHQSPLDCLSFSQVCFSVCFFAFCLRETRDWDRKNPEDVKATADAQQIAASLYDSMGSCEFQKMSKQWNCMTLRQIFNPWLRLNFMYWIVLMHFICKKPLREACQHAPALWQPWHLWVP